jgi:hypothetical protein
MTPTSAQQVTERNHKLTSLDLACRSLLVPGSVTVVLYSWKRWKPFCRYEAVCVVVLTGILLYYIQTATHTKTHQCSALPHNTDKPLKLTCIEPNTSDACDSLSSEPPQPSLDSPPLQPLPWLSRCLLLAALLHLFLCQMRGGGLVVSTQAAGSRTCVPLALPPARLGLSQLPSRSHVQRWCATRSSLPPPSRPC